MGNWIKISTPSPNEVIRIDLIGKTYRHARTYLEERGIEYQVGRVDQYVMVVPADIRPDRANLSVETQRHFQQKDVDAQNQHAILRTIEDDPDTVIVRGVSFG